MQQLAENIWIVDGETVSFFKLPYTTRMTIVRLPGNKLWLHSPVRLTTSIAEALHTLGQVTHLVAPNHLHYLFISEWQQHYPRATSYGTREVIEKRGLGLDHCLDDMTAFPWHLELQHEIVTGSPMMEECVFFHAPSRTLILTDLIENFCPQHFNWWQRLITRKVGVLGPNGSMPLDWRLSFFMHKNVLAEHIERIKSWRPERIVMAHGEIIEEDAQAFFDRAFAWVAR